MSSADWNTLKTDLADGVSFAIAKDGSSTTTDRVLFAQGIGLSSGAAATPSLNFTADVDSGFYYTGTAVAGVFAGATVFSWNAAGLVVTGILTVSSRITVSQFLNVPQGPTVTIASGVITPTTSRHPVDTEGGAASDDLDTISTTGTSSGDLLILQAVSSARTVVVKHNTGNIQCGSDRTLDNTNDQILLMRAGSNWVMLSFADNGA
jgi:hypothetical protein